MERISRLTGEFDKEMADSILKVSIDANRQFIKEIGLQQGQKITATRMLQSGRYTLDEIADISGLSLEEIKMLEEI